MENNQKNIIAPLVIIIIILVLGSGFYYYSKNQKVNKPEEQTQVKNITDNTSNASNTPSTPNKASMLDPVKDNAKVQEALNVKQDTQLRAMVANLGSGSEFYYDSHMSYTDMCKASGTAFSKTFNEIKARVGNDAKCYDGKDYAVSVKLSSGEFYCVDSTGFRGKTSKPASSSVCPE
jgi:hypothetical protein